MKLICRTFAVIAALIVAVRVTQAQEIAPDDLEYCLSQEWGFTFRDGKLVAINVPHISTDREAALVRSATQIESLRLSANAARALGIATIADTFSNLKELQVRRSPGRQDKLELKLPEYDKLLGLPVISSLTLEGLLLDDPVNRVSTRSAIKQLDTLDVVIHLKSRLTSVLENLDVQRLRIQVWDEDRQLNSADLAEIGQQLRLQKLTIVAPLASRAMPLGLRQLTALEHLAELELHNIQINPLELLQLTHLKKLHLRSCQFVGGAFDSLLAHPSLETLVLRESTTSELNLTSPLTPAATTIKSIELQLPRIGDLEFFANASCDISVVLGNVVPNERYLERYFIDIQFILRELGRHEVAELSKIKRLRRVQFTGFMNTTSDEVLLALLHLPSLSTLQVDNAAIKHVDKLPDYPCPAVNIRNIAMLSSGSPGGAEFLSQLMIPSLEVLSITRPVQAQLIPFPDSTSKKRVLQRLTSLELREFLLPRDRDMFPLAQLGTSLNHLSFSHCEVTNEGLQNLSKHATHVTDMQFFLCSFDREPSFKSLEQWEKLQSIAFNNCDFFGDYGKVLTTLPSRVKSMRIGSEEMFSW